MEGMANLSPGINTFIQPVCLVDKRNPEPNKAQLADLTAKTREEMRTILAEIRDGSFAREWIAENEKGCPNFLATRQREQTHRIEHLGPKLRAMMPFLQPVVAPGLATKAAASDK